MAVVLVAVILDAVRVVCVTEVAVPVVVLKVVVVLDVAELVVVVVKGSHSADGQTAPPPHTTQASLAVLLPTPAYPFPVNLHIVISLV